MMMMRMTIGNSQQAREQDGIIGEHGGCRGWRPPSGAKGITTPTAPTRCKIPKVIHNDTNPIYY